VIISGMGELHLEIIVDSLLREFKVEATVGKPQVAYRETITAAATHVEGRHIKQTGGKGQYGHIYIDVAPLEFEASDTEHFLFTEKVTGGEVPSQYFKAISQGVKDSLRSGPLAGFPVLGVSVTLTGGTYHEVDSSEMAFKAAGALAMREAFKVTKPRLLEPTMKVEVVCPEEYTGPVHSDLTSRRGHVFDIAPGEEGHQILKAEVPLAHMFGYYTDLRNKTQGRATYTMEFHKYAEVQHSVADEITRKLAAGNYSPPQQSSASRLRAAPGACCAANGDGSLLPLQC
jgi:elongation factor G